MTYLLGDTHFDHGNIIEYCDRPFTSPEQMNDRLRANWDGWVVHGHHHNNWPEEFPFVNPRRKQVNVSVELIEYAPLPLAELCAYLDDGNWRQSRPPADDRPTVTDQPA